MVLKFLLLKKIEVPGGNVFHAMKNTDDGYNGFGEVYFSKIEPNAIKAWKRHKEMTLNLVVPVGKIRFVLYDDRKFSNSYDRFYEVTLSKEKLLPIDGTPNDLDGFSMCWKCCCNGFKYRKYSSSNK